MKHISKQHSKRTPSGLSRKKFLRLPAEGSRFATQLLRSFLLFIVSSYLYIFLEWVFFVTKPSLFTTLSSLEALTVLAISPLFVLVNGTLGFLTAALLAALLGFVNLNTFRCLILLTPATVLITATVVLLIDNFTNTLFGFNAGSFLGPQRYGYALVYIVVFVVSLRQLLFLLATDLGKLSETIIKFGVFSLLFISFCFALVSQTRIVSMGDAATARPQRELPNILILSSDGVSAKHMSAYGYSRPTTPFIETLLPEALVFENHHTNAAQTTAAVGALLSGKLPTRTHVIFRPDIFKGVDVYQHLPGVLKNLGYYLGDFSVRHFADPYDLNMRNAFHYANYRQLDEANVYLQTPRVIELAFPFILPFIEQSFGRVENRVLHAFGIRDFNDPFAEVTQLNHASQGSDSQRISDLLDFIDKAPQPFFAHVHLLGTHGWRFYPKHVTFSKGQAQNDVFLTNFYDDAVLDYDWHVREVVRYLKENDKYDNTLLILNSDHGKAWAVDEAVPLIIKFPNQERTGTLKFTSQRIDIAPSILDYLNVPIPDWMMGQSVISAPPDPMRPIISSHTGSQTSVKGWHVARHPVPPFYTLNSVSVIYCHYWYQLELNTMAISSGLVRGHTDPCLQAQMPTNGGVKSFIIEHLKESGYQVP